MFFTEYLILYTTPPNFRIDLIEVKGLVVPAIRYIESRNRQYLAGQVRFYKIVNRVLESGFTLDWVSTYGGSIKYLFASGLSKLLDYY